MAVEFNDVAFIDALNANAGNVGEACRTVGVSRRTYENRYNREQSFRDKVDDIFLAKSDNALASLYREGLEGDVNAAKYFQEVMEKRVQQPFHGSSGSGGQRKSLASMSVAELDHELSVLKAQRNNDMKNGAVVPEEEEFIDEEPDDEFEETEEDSEGE